MTQLNLDQIVDRETVSQLVNLSLPTIYRAQKRGEFPKFERLSPARVGLRSSCLQEFLNGRRDWG
ncbi:helix-turn-helix transcriptional regulator [Erythrobacter sp. GH1-10]|uniref:helix-turn-helix transcriptional regulator n=1 Tax=Erythrobacter sp. GH1-10 TaxID=3349334 RepID=UPI003877D4DA